jgi:hypothetical protein
VPWGEMCYQQTPTNPKPNADSILDLIIPVSANKVNTVAKYRLEINKTATVVGFNFSWW